MTVVDFVNSVDPLCRPKRGYLGLKSPFYCAKNWFTAYLGFVSITGTWYKKWTLWAKIPEDLHFQAVPMPERRDVGLSWQLGS